MSGTQGREELNLVIAGAGAAGQGLQAIETIHARLLKGSG